MVAGNGIIDGTDRVRRTIAVTAYFEAWPSGEVLKTLPQYHGKRGKKGKANKDWNK